MKRKRKTSRKAPLRNTHSNRRRNGHHNEHRSVRRNGRRNVHRSRRRNMRRRKSQLHLTELLLIALLALLVWWKYPYITNQLIKPAAPALLQGSEYSESTVIADPDSIPDYSGEDYVLLNDGKPNFNTWDIEHITGEYYSELDSLGRCGTAVAMLHHSMMPTEERGKIGQVKPTGWVQEKYEGIVDSNPPYLYNRCHLIAYALTGQNANERNLITGTRYMNVSIMLEWEKQVMRYLDDSDHRVLYRVTPYFKDRELLARGVEMEAYSVEDNGKGVCFHVFIYNVQPGIVIDYRTGESRRDDQN